MLKREGWLSPTYIILAFFCSLILQSLLASEISNQILVQNNERPSPNDQSFRESWRFKIIAWTHQKSPENYLKNSMWKPQNIKNRRGQFFEFICGFPKYFVVAHWKQQDSQNQIISAPMATVDPVMLHKSRGLKHNGNTLHGNTKPCKTIQNKEY